MTDKYQEADIWLAEQIGECVHDWEGEYWQSHTSGDHHDWYCKNPKCRKIVRDFQLEKPPSVVDTPRSKDLGAMVNAADKLRVMITKFYTALNGEIVVTLRKINYDTLGPMNTQVAFIKDHESPQHAAAWAIYKALRKVKK